MAARYDLQEAWRERYKMDEFGVGAAAEDGDPGGRVAPQPDLLGPGPARGRHGPGSGHGRGAACHRRSAWPGSPATWGVVALGAAAAVVAATGKVTAFAVTPAYGDLGAFPNAMQFVGSTLALVFLAAAVLPFSGAIARFLRRPLLAASRFRF